MAAPPPEPEPHAHAPALPAIAVDTIFSCLAGDVPSLCAAACVCRAWAAAAAAPALWAAPLPLPSRAAYKLTDARLAWLVRRAGAELRAINLADVPVHYRYGLGLSARGTRAVLRAAPPGLERVTSPFLYGEWTGAILPALEARRRGTGVAAAPVRRLLCQVEHCDAETCALGVTDAALAAAPDENARAALLRARCGFKRCGCRKNMCGACVRRAPACAACAKLFCRSPQGNGEDCASVGEILYECSRCERRLCDRCLRRRRARGTACSGNRLERRQALETRITGVRQLVDGREADFEMRDGFVRACLDFLCGDCDRGEADFAICAEGAACSIGGRTVCRPCVAQQGRLMVCPGESAEGGGARMVCTQCVGLYDPARRDAILASNRVGVWSDENGSQVA